MPSWKRVVVSGSSAHLNQVTASGFYSKDTPWADIRAYGASPNESAANNVTYIQNAINSLPSDGGTVFFPRGTYELNDSLWVSSSNVTFHSDSAILECNI
jgi:polygalacturonase